MWSGGAQLVEQWTDEHDVAAGDRVRLVIPAEPGFVRLARLTVGAVAGRLGFSLDAVDDVQIAVDELCHALLEAGGGGTITLECTIIDGALEVRGRASPPAGQKMAGPRTHTRHILAAVTDAHDLDVGAATFRFRKRDR